MAAFFQALTNLFRSNGPVCPECGSHILAREDGSSRKASAEHCPNLDCPTKIAAWILHWCSPAIMDIPAMDQDLAGQLAKRRMVQHMGELYRFGPGDWESLDGITGDHCDRLLEQFQASLKKRTAVVIIGMCIPGVDAELSQRLLEWFKTVDGIRGTRPCELVQVEGVTEVAARAIRQWFCDPVNRRMIRDLENAGFRL